MEIFHFNQATGKKKDRPVMKRNVKYICRTNYCPDNKV